MATIRKETLVAAPTAAVWDAVRDIGALHTRLVPGMVTDTQLEDGGAVRVVTFADGMVLRERIVSIDDHKQRLVWAILGEPFAHHNASVEVVGDDRQCQVIWTADMLPHDLAETVAAIMERGLSITKQTQEATACPSGATSLRPVFRPVGRPTLHHISLFVTDLDGSIRFYTEGLGLSVRADFTDIIGQRPAGDLQFSVASVFLEDGDGGLVELHPAGDTAMSPPGFPLNHIAIAVPDVDTAYANALAAGGNACDIPVPDEQWDGTPLNVLMAGDRPEPMRMAFLQGASGELIELYQATQAN